MRARKVGGAAETGGSAGAPPLVPMPLERAVRWVPRRPDLVGGVRSAVHAVFVEQTVLRTIRAHVSWAGPQEVVGLLEGVVYACPESGRPYTVVRAARPAAEPLPEDASPEEVAAALQPLREVLDGRNGQVAGWYHTHALLGVFLSERDAEVHLTQFREPWQVAVVVVADQARPAGGLFGRTEKGGLRRSLYLPFYELCEEEARADDGCRPTVLDWSNYGTEAAVYPAPEGDTIPVSEHARRHEAEVETLGPPDGQEVEEDPGSRPEAPDASRSRAVPEAGAADRPPPRGEPVSHRSEWPAGIPVVLPADGERSWRQALRAHGGLVAGLLLAAVLLGGWLAWDRLSGPSGLEMGEAPAGAAETAGASFGSASEAVRGFASLVREFDAAVTGYADRRADFDLGRLGCGELSAGYRAVDSAFLALSEHYGGARRELGEAAASRYEEAAGAMQRVDEHFDASQCPRPN